MPCLGRSQRQGRSHGSPISTNDAARGPYPASVSAVLIPSVRTKARDWDLRNTSAPTSAWDNSLQRSSKKRDHPGLNTDNSASFSSRITDFQYRPAMRSSSCVRLHHQRLRAHVSARATTLSHTALWWICRQAAVCLRSSSRQAVSPDGPSLNSICGNYQLFTQYLPSRPMPGPIGQDLCSQQSKREYCRLGACHETLRIRQQKSSDFSVIIPFLPTTRLGRVSAASSLRRSQELRD